MTRGEPKFRRRKEARPGEIVAAALQVFAERGFAAARLDDIAARAGVSKGALYLYFETKEDLFRAVVRDAVAPNLDAAAAVIGAGAEDFAGCVRALASRLSALLAAGPFAAVAKMVVGESRNFPDLARIWHDQLAGRALALLTGLVEHGQARGEVRAGDPRFYAFSLAGPLVMGALWREVFIPVGAAPLDLQALAAQHVETVLEGLLASRGAHA